MANRFVDAVHGRNAGAPPIWLMRQAGRYHPPYQALRKRHGFLELCKNPELAAETAMGPMDDFGFDAAILFSDILFPLELLGVDVDFAPGPVLSRLLRAPEDLAHYTPVGSVDQLSFQAEALRLTRARIAADAGLIGFIGGPLTLYLFAVQQSRKNGVEPGTYAGLTDGRFEGLMDRLIPILIENMALQAEAGPDVMAVLDSAVDMLPIEDFVGVYRPWLARLLEGFAAARPETPVLYYAKGAGEAHRDALSDLPIAAHGVSHGRALAPVLSRHAGRRAIQGNLDPEVMTLDGDAARAPIADFLDPIAALPEGDRAGWICGLGHGITPAAKVETVRTFVSMTRERFG